MRLTIYAAALVTLGALAFAASASAITVSTTAVTTETGGEATTPTIHAVNEGGHVVLANSIGNIECSSTAEGKVESHGEGVPVSGNLSNLSFTGCTNGWHVTVTAPGSLSVEWTSGHDGTARSTGTKITTTRLGVTCNYETNNTIIGTLTGGNPATLDISASIPIASGSSGLCGTGNAKWSGAYVTTAALFAAPFAVEIDPIEANFGAVGEKKMVKIKNTKGVPYKIQVELVINAMAFKLSNTCNNKLLKPGEVCEETIECLKKNAVDVMKVRSGNPFFQFGVILES